MTDHTWVNRHDDGCPVTRDRASLLADLAKDPTNPYLLGAVPEYDGWGDQESELCECREWGKAATKDRGDIFVYGMLLSRANRPATLDGYRLTFHDHATIEPAPGEHVLGGVIVDADLGYYDGVEGAPVYYTRERVTLQDGSLAWTYVMNDMERDSWPPYHGYVEMIAAGYRKFGYDTMPLWALAANPASCSDSSLLNWGASLLGRGEGLSETTTN